MSLEEAEAKILEYLKDRASHSTAEIAAAINLSDSRTRAILGGMSDRIESLGSGNRNRTYRRK